MSDFTSSAGEKIKKKFRQHPMPISHLKLIAKIEPMSSRLIGRFEKKLATALKTRSSYLARLNSGVLRSEFRRTDRAAIRAVLMAA